MSDEFKNTYSSPSLIRMMIIQVMMTTFKHSSLLVW